VKSHQVHRIRDNLLNIISVLEDVLVDIERAEHASGYHNTRIEELGLTVRTYNILKRARIDTVDDLVRWSWIEISDERNAGAITLNEIGAVLDQMGLHLRDSVECKPGCTLSRHGLGVTQP